MMPGDPVVGSTILRRPAIQSPNFVTQVSGWTINADGSAEFNNLTIRGTFQGTEFVINSSGQFFYSPTEAAGNLVESIANAAGTDSFGDNYVAGHATYGSTFATSLNAGVVTFYTGSLSGGWTAGAQIETDGSGDLLLLAASGRQVTTANNTLDNGTGGASVAGILNVNGSGMTVGNGSNASLTLNPKIATPPNFPTAGKTLAQTQACLDGLITSFQNRGMVN